jgi:hypothetical protein
VLAPDKRAARPEAHTDDGPTQPAETN